MQKSYMIKIILFQMLAIIAFFICTALSFHMARLAISLVSIGLSAATLLYAYMHIKPGTKGRAGWLIILWGYLLWMLGNTIIIAQVLFNMRADHSLFTPILCMGANTLFMIGTVSFTIAHYGKWSKLQYAIDLITIVLLTVMLVWQIYFCRKYATKEIVSISEILLAMSIILDFVTVTNVATYLVSIKKGGIPKCFVIISEGLLLYAFSDAVNANNMLSGQRILEGIVPGLYLTALAVVSIGAIFRINNPCFKLDQIERTSVQKITRNSLGVLLYPAIALVLNAVTPIPYILNDLVCFGVIILCYYVAVLFVHNYMKAQLLVKKEEELRDSIQAVVSDQMEVLNRLANEDTVTKLYNRRYFMEKLQQELDHRQKDEIIITMLLDVNRFKAINDTYGHYAGDMVLRVIADRMKKWNTYGAVLARYGGDEFIIFVRGRYNKNQVHNIASSLVNSLAGQAMIEGNDIKISISLGIAMCPDYADDVNTLLRYADIAMYRAKSSGGNKYVFFNPVISEYIKKKNELGFRLERAIKESRFNVFYQPLYSLPDTALIGAEALLRWNDDKYGYVPPSEFIPIAEELGCIKELGSWVTLQAFMQIVKWNRDYGLQLKVGVNISPKELEDDEFLNMMDKNIRISQVNPAWIDIEIIESAVLEDCEKMNGIFNHFKSLGATVSVDDFGTGYSSMSYLKKYSFSRIKIDKSLMDKISSNESDRKIVTAIIAMSKSIGIETVAEGIETPEQLEILKKLGCDQVQSFLLGRPVPAHEFEEKYIKPHVDNNC